jgi:hypothetical protein
MLRRIASNTAASANIQDDHELLEAAMPVYDALYTWCRDIQGDRPGWHPNKILQEARS